MTGFGNSTSETDAISVSVELRAVNNRYLKLHLRLPDSLNCFENRVEKLVRTQITRGTVQLSMRARFPHNVSGYVIDVDAIQEYRRQLASLSTDMETGPTPRLTDLLVLPGVVVESELLPDLRSTKTPIPEIEPS